MVQSKYGESMPAGILGYVYRESFLVCWNGSFLCATRNQEYMWFFIVFVCAPWHKWIWVLRGSLPIWVKLYLQHCLPSHGRFSLFFTFQFLIFLSSLHLLASCREAVTFVHSTALARKFENQNRNTLFSLFSWLPEMITNTSLILI